MGLPYDPNMGCLRTAIAVSHSVLPHVFRGMEFWLFMFIHLVLYFSYRSGILNPQWTKVTEDLAVSARQSRAHAGGHLNSIGRVPGHLEFVFPSTGPFAPWRRCPQRGRLKFRLESRGVGSDAEELPA